MLTETVQIDAPPEVVFPYFTRPELIVRWMGEWADLQPEPGGRFALDITGHAVRGEYLELDPPHRLTRACRLPESPEYRKVGFRNAVNGR